MHRFSHSAIRRLKTASILLRRLRIWGWFRHCLDYWYYDIDRTVRFNGKGTVLSGIGDIRIGRGSSIGGYSFIQSNHGLTVTIGEYTYIAPFVCIYTETWTGRADVTIGNNCRIGVGSWIRQGVTIGDNVTIGAKSVVLEDIPANSIAVGVPARVVNG